MKQEDDNEIMPFNYEDELNKIVINESQNNSFVSERIEAILATKSEDLLAERWKKRQS